MGLLKHAVLPFYVLINAFLAYKALVEKDFGGIFELDNFGRDLSKVPPTSVEKHLLDALGGTSVCFLINCLAAIFMENSHYRGMVVGLETLFFAIDAMSYVQLGIDVPAIIYVCVAAGVVGLAIHANEPGIFTKDHDAGKKKSK